MPQASEISSGPPFRTLVAATEGSQPWRRIVHATCGILLVGILHLADPSRFAAAAALGGLTIAAFLSDFLRLRVPLLNRWFFRTFRVLALPREAARPASSTWFAAGCFVTVAAFPTGIASAGILVLSLADPVAGYVGRRWGRRRLGAATLEGSVAFAVIAWLLMLPVAGPVPAAVIALPVAAVEAIPWSLDDNLTIPVAASASLWGTLLVLG